VSNWDYAERSDACQGREQLATLIRDC